MNMNLHKLASALALGCALTAHAADLDDINQANEKKMVAAQQSQQRIDNTSDQTRDLVSDYRATSKLVDDLKVYNRKLEIQIENQQKRLTQIEKSIADVVVIQRQITPLLERMIATLEQFVALDIPFHKEEREERIGFLRNSLERPDISSAEKFRQVLEAYKIENEYGRKTDTYTDTITVAGADLEVTVFQVGRIALLYQTSDLAHTGMWDHGKKQWVELDAGDYRDAVRRGIRIARKQASTNILELPIASPEAL